MQVNVWIAVRKTAHNAIKERLAWDEDTQGPYTGPVLNWVYRLFLYMHDHAEVQKLFRVDRVWFTQGALWREWTMWSVNFDESRENLQTIAERLNDLVATYPGMVKIVGAWWHDGRQVGTQFDANGDVVGTPVYPIDSRLLEFMPDLDDQGTRPTELSDVNLIFGQEPRRFS